MPASARIKLRFIENKFSETLEFGTIGEPRQTAELRNRSFSAPSCQLRVVASGDERTGILLGSTDSWTLRADNDDPGSKAGQGILFSSPPISRPVHGGSISAMMITRSSTSTSVSRMRAHGCATIQSLSLCPASNHSRVFSGTVERP